LTKNHHFINSSDFSAVHPNAIFGDEEGICTKCLLLLLKAIH
jgi:hypothetical protein